MDPMQLHKAQSAGAPDPAMAAGAPRRERARKEAALNCPRCNSTNTKFCYYNNYSLLAPRYLCKTCRRYWTEGGGSLRNVRVGGGSRKTSRPSSAASGFPRLMREGAHDLKVAFPHHGGRNLLLPEFAAFPSLGTSGGASVVAGDGATSSGVRVLSAMDLLRSTGC